MPGPMDVPEPTAPLSSATDAVTFGSFNNPAKVSDVTLDARATLLGGLSQSRLLLKGRPFADAPTPKEVTLKAGNPTSLGAFQGVPLSKSYTPLNAPEAAEVDIAAQARE